MAKSIYCASVSQFNLFWAPSYWLTRELLVSCCFRRASFSLARWASFLSWRRSSAFCASLSWLSFKSWASACSTGVYSLWLNHPAIRFFMFPNKACHSSSRNFAPIMKYTNESNRSQTKKSLRYIVEEPLGLNTRFRTMPLNFIECPLRLYEDGLLKSVDISASLPASLKHLLETTSGMSDPESRRNKPGMIVRPL